MTESFDIDAIVNQVYETQKKSGVWNDAESSGLELEDVPGYFANLHLSVSNAYEQYLACVESDQNPAAIVSMPAEDSAIELPSGLPIDLGAIIFVVFGFMKRLGVEPSEVMILMSECQRKYQEESFSAKEESFSAKDDKKVQESKII